VIDVTIRFGVSPIAWINDDMPELGGDTSVEQVLADARDIGFSGIELGGKFPRDPGTLKRLLDRYELELIGGWYSGNLLARDVSVEITAATDHLALLQAMGSRVWVHAETSNAIHGQIQTPLSETPRLSDADWSVFSDRLSQFAEYIQDQGVKFAYHHHLGTVVERADDLKRLIARTSSAVGLTLDTGHASLGGIDPVGIIQAHPDRIVHVHCKDVRRDVFASVSRKNQSFLKGVLAGMFTVPGDGSLDYNAIMRALSDMNYSGWIVVEAEQDPAVANPRRYCELGLKTLLREAATADLGRGG
jgi:inosose dehydratase